MNRMFRSVAVFLSVLMLVAGLACTAGTPLAPETSSTGTSAAEDGSTLKVSAPTQVSPAAGAILSGQFTFVVEPAQGNLGGRTLLYEFEIQTETGAFVRSSTVATTTFISPGGLNPNTNYRWRARASLEGASGPWSGTRNFTTPSGPPGCIDGLLLDPRAYFFFAIGRNEGDPAGDWESVMINSGIPRGLPSGVRPGNSPHYGITQQMNSGGVPRGVIFLPTDVPETLGFFTHEFQVALGSGPGARWVWIDRGGAPYAPRPCP
jgi:hypothetical protein